MKRYSLLLLFAFSLLLSTCFSNKGEEQHFSESGLIPEAYVPEDVDAVLSFSSKDEKQWTTIQEIEKQLGDDDRISRTASESLDAQLGAVGLNFERDLKPAFGEQFHIVYAIRSDGENPDNFTVVTLADPRQMEEVLTTLEEGDQLSAKKLSQVEAYVDEDNELYLTVYEDLLFVTNSPDNLVGMVDQKESESLWGRDEYQEALEQVGGSYVFYVLTFPGANAEGLNLPSGFSVSDIPTLLGRQLLVVRAEEGGLRFDAWVTADKDAAKKADFSLDSVPRVAPYLFEEIPGDRLMGYMESYGLKQSLEEAEKVGDDTGSVEELRTTVRSYLGMDLDEELLSFLDKGYALALHQNPEGVVPGITIYVDVSSNVESAGEFVDQVDAQLSGLLFLFESSMPGMVSQGGVTWGGSELNRLTLDLTQIPRSEESPLPTAVTASTIQLVYGIIGDRLVISTLADWADDAASVAESALYERAIGQMKGVDEGLILVDAQGVKDFVAALRALREQLGLQVSDGVLELEDFLEGFSGAMAQSKTKAYESHFGGVLLLAE